MKLSTRFDLAFCILALMASTMIARLFALVYPPALAYWHWLIVPPLLALSIVYLFLIAMSRKYTKTLANQMYGAMAYGEGQATAGALRRSKADPEYQDEQEPEAAPKVAIDNNTKNRLVLK